MFYCFLFFSFFSSDIIAQNYSKNIIAKEYSYQSISMDGYNYSPDTCKDCKSDFIFFNKDGSFLYEVNLEKSDSLNPTPLTHTIESEGFWSIEGVESHPDYHSLPLYSNLSKEILILNYLEPDTTRFFLISNLSKNTLTLIEGDDRFELHHSFLNKVSSFSRNLNSFFVPIVEFMGSVIFFDITNPVYIKKYFNNTNFNPLSYFGQNKNIPFIVIWLVFGAVFFTFKMSFINFRGFKHAISLVRGDYDDPQNKGEVSHFQALTTALSGTVGLGNIAGVAIAISLGGPGATFWMIVAGLLGMSSKFVECTLGVKYRHIDANGVVSGGPMYYLRDGLKKRNLENLGKFLAVLFAILCVGGSIGGGNMFQANQAFSAIVSYYPSLTGLGPVFGVFFAILVGVVIIGGIKSIARVTEKIVPFMAAIYVGASLIIIITHFYDIGFVISQIIKGAFTPEAGLGGFIGVLIVGFKRAAFSNEAGVGSASIAHSAAKTKEPVSEGMVALLEPFIDTVVICTMTAFVIIITGHYENVNGLGGSELTSMAFGSVISWFPFILMIAILLFAFSTMISWSYYGLKSWTFLFGKSRQSELSYKIIFMIFIVIGSSASLGAVVDFSDMMILAMAFPNIIGLLIMSNEVKVDLKDYFEKIKQGIIKKHN